MTALDEHIFWAKLVKIFCCLQDTTSHTNTVSGNRRRILLASTPTVGQFHGTNSINTLACVGS